MIKLNFLNHTTLADKITLARVGALPFLLLLLAAPSAFAAWAALFLFAVLCASDWLDGYLARRRGEISQFGQMLDPIADKLLVGAVLFMLAHDGRIDGWTLLPALLIVLREIAVSGLREFLALRGISLPVSRMGKWKTAVQMFGVGLMILAGQTLGDVPLIFVAAPALWLAAGLSVFSAYQYSQAAIAALSGEANAS